MLWRVPAINQPAAVAVPLGGSSLTTLPLIQRNNTNFMSVKTRTSPHFKFQQQLSNCYNTISTEI
jgi:hypothetical protein